MRWFEESCVWGRLGSYPYVKTNVDYFLVDYFLIQTEEWEAYNQNQSWNKGEIVILQNAQTCFKEIYVIQNDIWQMTSPRMCGGSKVT